MKIIVGLGNPGAEYVGTRHNIGFNALDAWGHKQGASFTSKSKFKADVTEAVIGSETVLLVKPTTFYNVVGESLQLVLAFYKASATDVLVIHDELALPFGTLRSRQGGSDAGNNGIKSINQYGGKDTYRLRVGIASPMRAHMGDTSFVLGRFSAEERSMLDTAIVPAICQHIDSFVAGTLDLATHRHSA